ncbi:MAG: VWA domain-containing protein [Candidatus Aminicenantes bacterium]|nr:VWA domain-containing protein [Candidatus Aminicenantes bacterium]
MKKFIFPFALLLLSFCLFSQIEKHEVLVTNVVVPVRVFEGERFVDHLTIEDFELFENYEHQKIEALYLIRKTNIEREEALKKFNPALTRHFYLIFQITDYNPRFAEASGHLFNQVLLPGDTLTIMTPMDTYALSKKALETKSKERLSSELLSILRKDTKMGAANYRSLMNDLRRLVRSISASTQGAGTVNLGFESESITGGFDLETLLQRYQETLLKMEQLRLVDETKFIRFAAQVKKQTGPKNVYFFYQREFRPEITSDILTKLTSLNQDKPEIIGEVQNLFQLYRRSVSFDVNKITTAFADSSLSFNLIFMHKEPENVSGIRMREQSEDMFSAFSQVAKATGGIIDSSQNPSYAFKNAAAISESYYLLYYSPKNYIKDGKFKTITVRTKNLDYKVTHRKGYYSN